MEIEDVITKMREDLKKAKKSDLVEMVIQSKLQVMDLVWSLDNERKGEIMLKKIINWLSGKVEMPEPVDTSPVQFQTWLNEQIGKTLRGGDTYYAICIVGHNHLPKIGDKLKVWPTVKEAEAERYDLQKDNPNLRLHVRRVRIMYSFTDM